MTRSVAADTRLRYPVAPTTNAVDTYFGTAVPDPYRGLEDVDAPATADWILAEASLTESFLTKVPARKRLRKRLTEIIDYEKIDLPFHRGSQYFFTRNSGLQNQAVLYTHDGPTGTPRILLDPNSLSPDGTVAVVGYGASKDGTLLAYATANAGSDWETWRVREVASGRDRPDLIEWSKFGGAAWLADNAGFFYSAYDKPANAEALKAANFYHKLYFHRLGMPQASDRLVYERRDQKAWIFNADVTEDGRYAVITASEGTDRRQRISTIDLRDSSWAVRALLPRGDAAYSFVTNDGPIFYFVTDRDAPRGRLIALDISAPERVREVIAERPATLQAVTSTGGRFFASYLADARCEIRVHGRDGRLAGEVALPGIGSASGFGGERDDTQTYYSFSGFTTPPTTYRYDIAGGTSTLVRRGNVKFDCTEFTTEQVFFPSKDGTRVPMFVSYKKGLRRDGKAPTVLSGYGGFNIPLTPAFSASRIVWMELGGILAVANLRGGSEYGEQWHEAGMLERKQNVFDDFVAGAQYLIDQKYTSTPKLAIQGGSNGGLLVGAAMTQRPDLFGAALAHVGVLDMLRYDKFTIGHAWIPEYGSAERSAAEFKTLFAYSPLHNIKSGTAYPPTWISTGDHDDRVFPAHSFKFAAALQQAQRGDAPVLLRVETRAGHGAGKPTSKVIDELTDDYAFLVKTLGIDY